MVVAVFSVCFSVSTEKLICWSVYASEKESNKRLFVFTCPICRFSEDPSVLDLDLLDPTEVAEFGLVVTIWLESIL